MKFTRFGMNRPAAILLAFIWQIGFSRAADMFWTNAAGGSFQTPVNWSPNTVPAAGDNARFSGAMLPTISWTASRTNANALLNNAPSGGMQAGIGTSFWLLTNSLVVGQNANSTSTVLHLTGTLLVTNLEGTARFVVGQNGRGSYLMQTPVATSVVDRLIATNVTPGVFTNSSVLLSAGSLTVQAGAHVITPGSDFLVGTTTNQPVALNFRGGTNLFDTGTAGNTVLGAAMHVVSLVSVTGSGTLWSNRNDLLVGSISEGSRLVISNGAIVNNAAGYLGDDTLAKGNAAIVTGVNSRWTNRANLFVGYSGSSNILIITNGGTVQNVHDSVVGVGSSSSNNTALVNGAGSLWANNSNLVVGGLGAFNTLIITNGGTVQNTLATIGNSSRNNTVVVSGMGSTWVNRSNLIVGNLGSFNSLLITNGGSVGANRVTVGNSSISLGNRLTVADGTLLVTNTTFTAVLDVRRGTNLFTGGFIEADTLLLTNGAGRFHFNGGTLKARQAAVTNGAAFVVGNGIAPANYFCSGADVLPHAFANGLVLATDATLSGSGTVNGLLTVNAGATVSPGAPVGRLILTQPPTLGGRLALDVGKSGGLRTNDVLELASGTLTYGGTLTITDVGTDALAAGDRFHLFPAPGYEGGFSSLTLPPLALGLEWTNKLQVDGSIEVIPAPPNNRYWTNVMGGQYQIGNNWLPNLVPTAEDKALFTGNASYQVTWTADATVAEALFNAPGGTVTQAIDGFAWTVTNRYALGTAEGLAPMVRHAGGTLTITNAARNALMDIRHGTFVCEAGRIETDQLVQTNGTAGFKLNGGTLVTRVATISNTVPAIGEDNGPVPAAWIVLSNPSPTTVGGNLGVGGRRPLSQLILTNGGVVECLDLILGREALSRSNRMVITGVGSTLRARVLGLGEFSAFNTLRVEEGGTIECAGAVVGNVTGASNNVATVRGAGSKWMNAGFLRLGDAGAGNTLQITDGGVVSNTTARIGVSSNNSAIVSGPGSRWINNGLLEVGRLGPSNLLHGSDGGLVQASNVIVGTFPSSSDNLVRMVNASLVNTNTAGSAALDVRRGTVLLNGGTLTTDRLVLTNGGSSRFTFHGGTLHTRFAAVTNGSPFTVGNGDDAAISFLEGAPTNIHAFADGLVLSSNATLTGNGTLDGQLTVTAGGTVAPGASVGHLNLTRPPALAGTLALEFSKSGGALTNDRIALSSGTLAYGGTLVVTDLGPEPLAAGDSLQLFLAPGYAGGFSSLTLPALPGGLGWYNQLAANGTLTVVRAPAISSVVRAGTDLVLTVSNGIPGGSWQLLTATNVALPLSGWTTNSSGFADPSGNVILTNPLILTEPRRFFRLQQP